MGIIKGPFLQCFQMNDMRNQGRNHSDMLSAHQDSFHHPSNSEECVCPHLTGEETEGNPESQSNSCKPMGVDGIRLHPELLGHVGPVLAQPCGGFSGSAPCQIDSGLLGVGIGATESSPPGAFSARPLHVSSESALTVYKPNTGNGYK